jgi:uncharacterized membrane protein
MDITLFIAQFMGWFMAVIGGVMLLKRQTVDRAIRGAAKERGTMLVLGLFEVAVAILLLLVHSSWDTLLDKAVSILSWFLLLEGLFYMAAKERSIQAVLRFIHTESVYYSMSLAFIVVGVALILGA